MKFQHVRTLGITQVKVAFAFCAFLELLVYGASTARGQSPPVILSQPTNQLAAFFGSAMFSVTVSNTTATTYQWEFNNEPVADATNSILFLGPLTYAQAGSYSVIVSNSGESITSSKANLTVSEPIVSTSLISSNIQNFLLPFTNLMAVSANSSTIYALESTGTAVPYSGSGNEYVPPGLTNIVSVSLGDYANNLILKSDGTVLAWDYNIAGATNAPAGLSNVTAVATAYLSTPYDFALRSGGTVVGWNPSSASFQVLLSNVVAIAAGINQFIALKADGTVIESESDHGAPPVMIPVPGVSNVISIAAGNGSLALKADGTLAGWDGLAANPLPNVSNIVAIALGDAVFLALQSDGAVVGSPVLIAQFPVGLSNAFAIDVNPIETTGIVLFGNGSPVFTVQPANQTLTNGGTIWLHTRAVGTQPMSYQWQLNGNNIPNATNADLTISNAQGKDSGQYRVLVANSVGNALSVSAFVTTPSLPSQLGLPTFLPGGNLFFQVFTTNGSLMALGDSTDVIFETSSNLIEWIPLTNAVIFTNGGAQFYDPNATNSPARFYRLNWQ